MAKRNKKNQKKIISKKEKIHGYYFDGKIHRVMIEDEDGYIEMQEIEDNKEQTHG
tara:strand:+ start:3603 stop:3767 length:165 start_codon:yes stop_codon:yes gene_type:complete